MFPDVNFLVYHSGFIARQTEGPFDPGRGEGVDELIRSVEEHEIPRNSNGRPGKGNDKGKIEGLIGYARRNFLVPIPRFESFEALNDHLEARCRERQGALSLPETLSGR